jgi:ATP-dependent Clp protease adaptor protein ClpS
MDDKDPEKQSGEEDTSSTAVKAAPSKKKSPKKTPPATLPPWKVLLHNDDVNDMVYVRETIVALTPLNSQDAETRMREAHLRGVSLLLTTHKERAELYRDQFTSKGLTVTIEAAK